MGVGVRAVPVVKTTAHLGEFLGRGQTGRVVIQEIGTGQSSAPDRNRVFSVGKDGNNPVRAERGKRGRFQHHPRPHFSRSKIIDETESSLAKHFGSEMDSHFGLMMDRHFILQSIERDRDRNVVPASNDVEMFGRERKRNQRHQLLEQLQRTGNQGSASANGPAVERD